MKRIHLIPAFLISMSSILTLVSCMNEDDPAVVTPPVIENNMQSGNWRITTFIDSGNDETNHFAGYTFTFEDTGALISTNGSNTYTGAWNVSDSSSNDDSPGDLDFNILFALTNHFEDLNEDWHIISQATSRIELIHISGGNGGTDYLTFQKI